jgi:hypothetical protein
MTENPLVEQSTESQNTASESLGLQDEKIDLGGVSRKLTFEQINETTSKLADGRGSNAWAGDRSGSYRTTRAVAWIMGLGNGQQGIQAHAPRQGQAIRLGDGEGHSPWVCPRRSYQAPSP